MSDELDRHVLKKYDIQQKLGKGVRIIIPTNWSAQCQPLPPSSHTP